MNQENRRFPRTDRPGSGIYRGEESHGVAFDDYRSADEQEIQHRRERPGPWRAILDFFVAALFPLANDQMVSKAETSLARDPALDLSRVHFSADAGAVIVRGSVPTRWMKERISDQLLDMKGIHSIRNELEVRPEHPKLPQEGSLTG